MKAALILVLLAVLAVSYAIGADKNFKRTHVQLSGVSKALKALEAKLNNEKLDATNKRNSAKRQYDLKFGKHSKSKDELAVSKSKYESDVSTEKKARQESTIAHTSYLAVEKATQGVHSQIDKEMEVVATIRQLLGKKNNHCTDNLVLISKGPKMVYNIKKEEAEDVVSRIKRLSAFTNVALASKEDVKGLIEINKPVCFCGWTSTNGKLHSVYPSSKGTVRGCGNGANRLIVCDSWIHNSWAKGNSGIYVRINAEPSIVNSELKNIGLVANVLRSTKSKKC